MWGAVMEASGRKGMLSIFIYFGCAAQLAGSQFPDQGLNLGHGSESAES